MSGVGARNLQPAEWHRTEQRHRPGAHVRFGVSYLSAETMVTVAKTRTKVLTKRSKAADSARRSRTGRFFLPYLRNSRKV
eukprot:2712721-Rhodomonas_salina.1